jgi:IPT/TIG domain/Cysteine-rich secretory protein family
VQFEIELNSETEAPDLAGCKIRGPFFVVLRVTATSWPVFAARICAASRSPAIRRLAVPLIGALAIAILPALPSAPHSPVHLATIPAASPPWLTEFNAWRANTGTSTLVEDSNMDAGDVLHATYMVQTGQVTHSESTAYPQYTVAGDTAAKNSNIFVSSSTNTSDVQSIDWWMGAPFHAMAMMDPRLTTTGFGSYRNSAYTWQMGAAVNVGQGMTAPGQYPVYFPGSGTTEPLTNYSGNEFPDPTQACPGYSGLPLFVEVGANVATTAGPVHTLTGNGAPLTNCVIDSTNSTFAPYTTWRGGVIVFPQSPLQNGVKYVVALTVNAQPYTWSFTVGALTPLCNPGPGGAPTVKSIDVSAGPISGGTTVTVSGCGFTGATGVKFGTSPATSYNFVSDSRVTAVSPAHAVGTIDMTVTTAMGTSAITVADQFRYAPLSWYFQWFDLATPGMVGDNIHLLNVSGATANITLTLPGASAINVALQAGQETYVSFGRGHIGGPVVVNSDQQVIVSQRVQYFQSFNEVWAMTAAQAATVSYINWFDRASAGMVGDNIHVLNPGTASSVVTVTLGSNTPITFTLGAGQETHVTFPAGQIGGPVKISATLPVLASQRVQYYQTFNEVVARSATLASTESMFNWFDRASAGMVGDNIHVLNPGTSTANVTVTLPGAPNIGPFPLQAGQETYVSFAPGEIGGPVTITSSLPVLASQRVQYFQSFNEVPAATQAQASTVSHIMWFDKATAGMVGDNIHVLNVGAATANITVSLPGASNIVFTLPVDAETYVTFPAGTIGGPVTISADQAVLAAQRVQYFQSFNEVASN